MSAPLPDAVEFLGLRFAPVTPDVALREIVRRADEHGAFCYVVTPNVDHVVALRREYERRVLLYRDAWLTLNDSRVLARLARWSGFDLPACPGSDLTAALFEKIIDPVESVTIVGGSEAVVAGVQVRYGLRDVRWHAPPSDLAENATAIARAAAFIAAQRARFVFLALGAPQQEIVANAALERGDCCGVGLCIGASLEILAGAQARASVWTHGRRYLSEGAEILGIWRAWRRRQRAVSRAAMASRN